MDNSSAIDVCGSADIGSLSLSDAPISLAPSASRDMSDVQAKGSDLSSGASATAQTTAKMQDLSLADTATKSQDPSNRDSRSTKELRKCLIFLVDKRIPQAEKDVEQCRRATEGVSTKTMMHRVYYDRAVSAQHGLDWLNEAREIIEKALEGETVMDEFEMRRLEHVKDVVLRAVRDNEAKEWCLANLEEG